LKSFAPCNIFFPIIILCKYHETMEHLDFKYKMIGFSRKISI
jgi:hypothetical protein